MSNMEPSSKIPERMEREKLASCPPTPTAVANHPRSSPVSSQFLNASGSKYERVCIHFPLPPSLTRCCEQRDCHLTVFLGDLSVSEQRACSFLWVFSPYPRGIKFTYSEHTKLPPQTVYRTLLSPSKIPRVLLQSPPPRPAPADGFSILWFCLFQNVV